MGWLSDKLFGKRKRLDPNKINSYMQPYREMVDEQEDIARDMMDPNSRMNLQQRQMMRGNQFDLLATQNQQISSQASMTGMSPGQLAAQQRMAQNQSMGQFGQQYEQMLHSQYGQGLGLLQGVMGQRQGIGEEQAGLYMQQINAANARRNQRMGMMTSLMGMGISAGNMVGNLRRKPTSTTGGGTGGTVN